MCLFVSLSRRASQTAAWYIQPTLQKLSGSQSAVGANAMLSGFTHSRQVCRKNHASLQDAGSPFSMHLPGARGRNDVPPSPSLLIIDIAVTAHHLALELLSVLVPQLGGLAVEGGGTGSTVSLHVSCPSRRCYHSLVGLSEQALEAEQNSLDVVGGRPLVLQDVQADAPREVHVWVVDGRLEQHRGRGIREVVWEGESELEGEPSVGGVIGALDRRPPGEQVAVRRGERRDAGRRRRHQLHELGL